MISSYSKTTFFEPKTITFFKSVAMNLLISSNLHEINPFKFWEKRKFFILTCYNNSIYKTWKQPSRTWPARQVQRTRSFFWQGYKGLLQYSVGAVFVLSLFFSFFFFLGLACEAVLYYRIQRIATVQRNFFFGLRTPLDSTKKSQTRFPLNSYYNYKRDFFFLVGKMGKNKDSSTTY